MPIAVVAVVEIVLAVVLAIWTVFVVELTPSELAFPGLPFAAAVINALAILRATPRARLGRWLVAIGGMFVLAIASANLWAEWVFPPATNFMELLVPAVQTIETVGLLALSGALSLLAGWSMVLVSRSRARRHLP